MRNKIYYVLKLPSEALKCVKLLKLMPEKSAKNIVDIESFGFANHLGITFLSIFGWMFVAFIISIFISGNDSNQTFIMLFYGCIIFTLFTLNVIGEFRKPFTYLYSISTSDEVVEIKFVKLFSNYVIEANIKDVNIALENEGNKNVCLIINGFNKEENFIIKQRIISQWKTKLIRETYDALNKVIAAKSNQ